MTKIFEKHSKTRLAVDLIILACVILIGITGWLWWTKIFMDPARVLNDAISNSLQTRSVTKTFKQPASANGVNQASISYLTFFSTPAESETKTVLTQNTDSKFLSVTTESIGTTDSDYVRYTDAQGIKNVPLNVWAKTTQDLEKGRQAVYLNQALFSDVILFGYFNKQDKSQLLDLINQKHIYKYTAARRTVENGRPVFTYDLSINPADLLELVKEYMQLSGIGNPSSIDPNRSKGVNDIKLELTVDILSRQIIKLQDSTGLQAQEFTGHNLYRPVITPSNTVPVEELQRRLQGQAASSSG